MRYYLVVSRQLKPCIVEWSDAWGDDGDMDISKAQEFEPVVTQSIGFLVSNTKKGVTIAMDCYPSDTDLKGKIKNYAFIPKRMVVNVLYLTS